MKRRRKDSTQRTLRREIKSAGMKASATSFTEIFEWR
jgi:hypothetical protein